MASTTKVDQAARAKARERRIALDKDRQARDARIEAGAAEVFAGVAARESAQAQVTAAEDTMATGLGALMKEGLTTVQVAELCELTVGEVQKLTKKRHRADGPTREVGTTKVPGAVRTTKVPGAGTGTRQPGSENVA